MLDCTLRDGGYVNDWNFGHNNLVNVFERLTEANIDIVEIGFLDERRNFDINRSIMPNTDSVEKIYGKLKKKNSMIVGMIDYGTCGLENIKPQKESFLDGIRVIFKKHLREPAMKFCTELKKLGYKVFSQLVSVTTYSDEEMMDLIKLANEVKPYAVSIVDTYGLLHKDNLLHYYNLLNDNLDESIGLGYHAHNNFQMGYSNCISILSQPVKRQLIVDGSLYGMGKSAGNAPIELVAMYMNSFCNKNYDLNQILEAIDANILNFYKPATWGYNMFYFLSAFNGCHPNYVSYLLNTRTLSIKSVNEILSKLEGDNKLLYNKNLIEKLYLSYQKVEIDDSADLKRLSNALKDKNILVLGPGNTIKDEEERIKNFIEENKPIVISINFIPTAFNVDYVFLTNAKRFVQLAQLLIEKEHKIIATSNVQEIHKNSFMFKLNFSALIDEKSELKDNSLIMLLNALNKIGKSNIFLAGFDGYKQNVCNYVEPSMEYKFDWDVKKRINQDVVRNLKHLNNMNIEFVTDSVYNEKENLLNQEKENFLNEEI